MKRLLLSAALVAISLTTFAQNQPQIPNGDFETWDEFSGCTGIDSLGNFISGDAALFNETTICNTSQSVIKSTDTYSGTYALKLTGINFLGLGMIGNYVNIGNDFENPDKGVPFTGRPTKLVGYYKFTKGGTDTLGISVGSYNANDDEVFYGEFTANSTVSTYTRFEIILNYDPLITSNPTSLNLFIALGNAINDEADAATVLFIDGLEFEYDISTSTTNYTSASPINVYSANKNINFSENVSDVQVVDMIGASKMQETSTTKTVNAASLTTGMYIVTYKYNDAYYSKKVVIE